MATATGETTDVEPELSDVHRRILKADIGIVAVSR
jgi:hypothetical protein